MTTTQIQNLQAARTEVRSPAITSTDAATKKGVCTLLSGAALSLTPNAPTALRIAEGKAWVTLDDVPQGARGEAAGDVFLHAGQTLWVATGQHAVVEPLGGRRLQYRLTGLAADQGRASWWHRIWGGAPSQSQANPVDACCA